MSTRKSNWGTTIRIPKNAKIVVVMSGIHNSGKSYIVDAITNNFALYPGKPFVINPSKITVRKSSGHKSIMTAAYNQFAKWLIGYNDNEDNYSRHLCFIDDRNVTIHARKEWLSLINALQVATYSPIIPLCLKCNADISTILLRSLDEVVTAEEVGKEILTYSKPNIREGFAKIFTIDYTRENATDNAFTLVKECGIYPWIDTAHS